MSYREAAEAFGREVQAEHSQQRHQPAPAPVWAPKLPILPCETWQRAAVRFLSECQQEMSNPEGPGVKYALSRHLSPETIQAHGIGWNPTDRWDDRAAWGLEPETNPETGKQRKVWFPAGQVIPCRRKAGITAIKIRRAAWHPEDKRPKYVAVSGSASLGMVLGGHGKPVMVVESELDALLVHQEAGDLVSVLALGSAAAKPDDDVNRWLSSAPAVLLALDWDQAGRSAASWWMDRYPALLWPVPAGKDVGDLPDQGISVRSWIEAGLEDVREVDEPRQSASKDVTLPHEVAPATQPTIQPVPVCPVPIPVPCRARPARIPAAAWSAYQSSRPWLRARLPALLAAGWTGRDLYGIGRQSWPWGAWGVAWARKWNDACPALDQDGAISWEIKEGNGETRIQRSRPAISLAKGE